MQAGHGGEATPLSTRKEHRSVQPRTEQSRRFAMHGESISYGVLHVSPGSRRERLR